jgi:hypothetical protein
MTYVDLVKLIRTVKRLLEAQYHENKVTPCRNNNNNVCDDNIVLL